MHWTYNLMTFFFLLCVSAKIECLLNLKNVYLCIHLFGMVVMGVGMGGIVTTATVPFFVQKTSMKLRISIFENQHITPHPPHK